MERKKFTTGAYFTFFLKCRLLDGSAREFNSQAPSYLHDRPSVISIIGLY